MSLVLLVTYSLMHIYKSCSNFNLRNPNESFWLFLFFSFLFFGFCEKAILLLGFPQDIQIFLSLWGHLIATNR